MYHVVNVACVTCVLLKTDTIHVTIDAVMPTESSTTVAILMTSNVVAIAISLTIVILIISTAVLLFVFR